MGVRLYIRVHKGSLNLISPVLLWSTDVVVIEERCCKELDCRGTLNVLQANNH